MTMSTAKYPLGDTHRSLCVPAQRQVHRPLALDTLHHFKAERAHINPVKQFLAM